jgi:hypothetical protein
MSGTCAGGDGLSWVELPTPPCGGSWVLSPMPYLLAGPYRVSAGKLL